MTSHLNKRPIDEISSPSSKGSRTRPRHDLDPGLKILDDPRSDNAHAVLDAAIIRQLRFVRQSEIAIPVAVLLLEQSRCTQKESDVSSLLQQFPSLKEISLEAYNSRSFKYMRGLHVFAPNTDMSEMWSQVTLKRVQPESDPINDEQHGVLDDDIYGLMLKKKFYLEDILVQLSRGKHQDLEVVTLDEAYSLLSQNPVLRQIIQSIESIGASFKEVRRLVYIRKPSGTFKPALDYAEKAQIIKQAWDVVYVGRAHEILLENINKMDRDGYYQNMVKLIQSSGSGKSRMVREQAKLVFTLPFNLLVVKDSQQLAWPPPDADVARYFTQSILNLEDAKILYQRFLGHLFRLTREAVLSLRPNGPKYENHAALALTWHEHMEKPGVRFNLYKEVLRLCPVNNMSDREKLGDVDDLHVTAAANDACQELKKLIETLDSLCMTVANGGNVKVMMYFDEARVLSESCYGIGGRTIFDVISYCIDIVSTTSFFCVFLSTHFHISKLVPEVPFTRSSRLLYHTIAHHAPITETPFDIGSTLPIQKDARLRLSDVGEIKSMAKFGRPLFWTYLAGAPGALGERMERGLIQLVREKLLCSKRIHMGHGYFAKQPDALTAMLDTLLNLNFDEGRQSTFAHETELVASHLRVVYSIPPHCQHFQSGYPSEPILAEAAVQQLDHFQDLAPDTNVFATLLQSHFDSGLLDQSKRGEIVMRQIFLTAYMRACKKDELGKAPALFSGGCRLVTFVEELFSEGHAQVVLNSKPHNFAQRSEESKSLRDTFKDAIVRFTHFGKMAHGIDPSVHTIYAAFVRCMAIICRSSQGGVDVILPILLFKDGVLSEDAMSVFMLQVKCGKTRSLYVTAREPGFCFKEKPRPYITMVAGLGVQKHHIPDDIKTSTLVQQERLSLAGSIRTKKLRAAYSLQTTQDTFSDVFKSPASSSHRVQMNSPCFMIVAHGCLDMIYRVIDPRDRDLYELLLVHRNVLTEHARQDSDSLVLVRKIKPFWSVDNSCYEWVEDEFLNHYPRMEPNTETGGAGRLRSN